MNITPIKTHQITQKDSDIISVVDQYILDLSENSILVITSKIVAIAQDRIVPMDEKTDKDVLIANESQWYLPRSENKYNVSMTITRNTLVASAGIDESNGDGYYILWPEDPQKVANTIREYLKNKFSLKHIGVLITDSRTTPMRWGVTALSIAFSGFMPLKDYIGKPDIFGRDMVHTKMSIVDNLSCAAALVMGEGSEQTPMAIVTEVPFVEFVDRNPTEEELKGLQIEPDEDLYAPLLKSVKWLRGKK